MFRSISNNFWTTNSTVTANSTVSVAAAVLVAGIAVFLMPAAPKAEAQAIASIPCTLSWPNYEQSCQFDLRTPSGDNRTVRIIALR